MGRKESTANVAVLRHRGIGTALVGITVLAIANLTTSNVTAQEFRPIEKAGQRAQSSDRVAEQTQDIVDDEQWRQQENARNQRIQQAYHEQIQQNRQRLVATTAYQQAVAARRPAPQTFIPPVHIPPPQTHYTPGVASRSVNGRYNSTQNFIRDKTPAFASLSDSRPAVEQRRPAPAPRVRHAQHLASPAAPQRRPSTSSRPRSVQRGTPVRPHVRKSGGHVYLQDRIAQALTRRNTSVSTRQPTPAVREPQFANTTNTNPKQPSRGVRPISAYTASGPDQRPVRGELVQYVESDDDFEIELEGPDEGGSASRVSEQVHRADFATEDRHRATPSLKIDRATVGSNPPGTSLAAYQQSTNRLRGKQVSSILEKPQSQVPTLGGPQERSGSQSRDGSGTRPLGPGPDLTTPDENDPEQDDPEQDDFDREIEKELAEGVDDDEDGPENGLRGIDKSCSEYGDELLATTIRDISLDISPPAESADAIAGGLYRTWTDRRGGEIATGTMVDLRRGYVILDSGQKIAYARLSQGDLAAVSEFWRLPQVCLLENRGGSPYRHWTPQTFQWTASNLCHKPLFFENIQLERYGHSRGPIAQPIHSTLHFFGSLVTVPYQSAITPPTSCQYALGFYRPGNCAPWLKDPIPFTLRGAVRQTLATTGLAFYP